MLNKKIKNIITKLKKYLIFIFNLCAYIYIYIYIYISNFFYFFIQLASLSVLLRALLLRVPHWYLILMSESHHYSITSLGILVQN